MQQFNDNIPEIDSEGYSIWEIIRKKKKSVMIIYVSKMWSGSFEGFFQLVPSTLN